MSNKVVIVVVFSVRFEVGLVLILFDFRSIM